VADYPARWARESTAAAAEALGFATE
jgi:hypothetical protein